MRFIVHITYMRSAADRNTWIPTWLDERRAKRQEDEDEKMSKMKADEE